jgi:hypothetical protein
MSTLNRYSDISMRGTYRYWVPVLVAGTGDDFIPGYSVSPVLHSRIVRGLFSASYQSVRQSLVEQATKGSYLTVLQ